MHSHFNDCFIKKKGDMFEGEEVGGEGEGLHQSFHNGFKLLPFLGDVVQLRGDHNKNQDHHPIVLHQLVQI